LRFARVMKLYTYWRSQASFRLRIALRLKGIEVETISLDLIKGDQLDAAYKALNPEMVVPTLLDGDGPPLVQSLAIIEYLEEKYPEPPLLPFDVRARAHVRAIAQMLAADAHPFIVPRVRKYLQQELHVDEASRMKWLLHWNSFRNKRSPGLSSRAIFEWRNAFRSTCSLVRRQSCLGPLSPAAHWRRVRWVAIYMTSSI